MYDKLELSLYLVFLYLLNMLQFTRARSRPEPLALSASAASASPFRFWPAKTAALIFHMHDNILWIIAVGAAEYVDTAYVLCILFDLNLKGDIRLVLQA